MFFYLWHKTSHAQIHNLYLSLLGLALKTYVTLYAVVVIDYVVVVIVVVVQCKEASHVTDDQYEQACLQRFIVLYVICSW